MTFSSAEKTNFLEPKFQLCCGLEKITEPLTLENYNRNVDQNLSATEGKKYKEIMMEVG